ncbi:MAG: GDSL-type esterase/lipase family protein [Candidatus Bathyarchaeia archaeon]
MPSEGGVRVACVGDSITEGSSYVSNLAQRLGGNYSVGNFGVGLASVSLATAKPYMNQSVFEQAKDFEPDKVVILLGTNDAITWYQPLIGNFSKDYKTLIAEFQDLPSKPQIYLVVPPPIFDDSLGPNSTILQTQIIPQIRQIAAETGLPLIDFYDEMAAHPEYSSDGVHLTQEGSRFVADKICQAIATDP